MSPDDGNAVTGPACAGLIGLPEAELVRRFGEPITRRRVGDDTWLMFRSTSLQLRVRCSGSDPARVASWTATFSSGHARLRDAAHALGLWPAAAPDLDAESVDAPLIRRPLPCPETGATHSLTATVRYRRITQISVFDEPPDWI